jgi:hypothetical protein
MSRAIRCDRCKEYYEEQQQGEFYVVRENVERLDLCEGCILSLKIWVCGKETKTKKKSTHNWSPERRAAAAERARQRFGKKSPEALTTEQEPAPYKTPPFVNPETDAERMARWNKELDKPKAEDDEA